MLINQIHDIYFKINSSLTDTKLCYSVNKLVILSKFLNTFPCWYAKIKMLFLLHFISLSIFLTSSIVSLWLPVFLIDSSKPLVSISSLLLMSEYLAFLILRLCSTLVAFWFHRRLKTKIIKNHQFLPTEFEFIQ